MGSMGNGRNGLEVGIQMPSVVGKAMPEPAELVMTTAAAASRQLRLDVAAVAARAAAAVTALLSLALMVSAKQRGSLTIFGLEIPLYANWSFSDSLEYLVGTSAAVATYSLLQLLLSVHKTVRKVPVVPSRCHVWLLFAGDQIFAFAMMSAGSAAAAVTNLNRTGIRHTALPNFSPQLVLYTWILLLSSVSSTPLPLTHRPSRPPPAAALQMPPKVVAIAAGEAHTLALTGDGGVYSWGRGTFGRLGTGREADELVPAPVAPAVAAVGGRPRPKFVAVAAGAYHSLAIDDEGSLWSWGYNIYGQLGYGEENSLFPCLVERFQDLGSDTLEDEVQSRSGRAPLKLSSVKAGGMMSFAIDNLGALWMWGNCPQQTDSGVFCIASRSAPLPVWDFHGHTVVKVACGNEHVVAAVSSGETYTGGDLVCYAWGNNSHGQLGLGDKESRSRPVLISVFNEESSWDVYEIACGASHTAVLTNMKSFDQDLESRCWTFGLGDNGQLGHGTTATICSPEPVNGLPRGAFLISLDCGLFHTTVVSSDGEVWCWGMEKGLGLCPDASFAGADAGDALYPIRVQSPETNGFKFLGPLQVACGAAHTVLVAGDGYRMWAWGRGRSGVLGRGQTNDSYIPCVVKWPPLDEDFQEIREDRAQASTSRANERGSMELEQKLSAATEDLQFLRSKLTLMERYANILHISIFRKPLDERMLLQSLQDSAIFDIRKEFENILEAADTHDLTRLEMFYRSMLSGVKDKLLKRRVQEMVEECIHSLSTERQSQRG